MSEAEKVQLSWWGTDETFGINDVALRTMRRAVDPDWKYRNDDTSMDKQLLYSWAAEYAGERAGGLSPDEASAKLWPYYEERGMSDGLTPEILPALEEEIAAELARVAEKK